jgi:hypothetical protein
MTNEEIGKFKQELSEIQKISENPQLLEPVKNLAKRIGARLAAQPLDGQASFINETINNIHTVLQTETMLNACVSSKQSCELAEQSSTTAKWSCFWAAIAAIASCISVLLVLFCG